MASSYFSRIAAGSRRRLNELLGYFTSSLAALLLDFGLLVLLVEVAGFHYLIASAVGFCSGALLLYGLSIRYIFTERRWRGNQATELSVFMLVGIIGLALTQLGLYTGVEILALPYPVAKMFSVAGVFWFNFLARRRLLFSSSHSGSVWSALKP
jgi:putative flippase GtrA